MFFKCKKENLISAVSKANKIIGRNLSLPVLQGINIETGKGEVFLRSTNLDLGFEVKIPAKVEKKGSAVAPADTLNGFLSNLKSEETIKVEQKKNNLSLKSDKYNISIKTLPKEDFPEISKINSKESIKINPSIFIKGLRSVWFSASNSNIKPELSSVFIKKEDGKIYFVSTDSFRLSEKKVNTKEKINFEEILVPQKNINQIIKILEDLKGEIEILFDDNQIAFKNQNLYLLSRVIDGTFPDYKQIIPEEFDTEVVLLKEDFINSLKLSNVFSDKFNQTTFKIKGKTLQINTKNSDVGSSLVKVDSKIKGKDITIKFNYKFLIECFQSITSDSVKLSLAGEAKPMLIEGVSDDSYLYIVMPMNK